MSEALRWLTVRGEVVTGGARHCDGGCTPENSHEECEPSRLKPERKKDPFRSERRGPTMQKDRSDPADAWPMTRLLPLAASISGGCVGPHPLEEGLQWGDQSLSIFVCGIAIESHCVGQRTAVVKSDAGSTSVSLCRPHWRTAASQRRLPVNSSRPPAVLTSSGDRSGSTRDRESP